jgi:hypothetical protein
MAARDIQTLPPSPPYRGADRRLEVRPGVPREAPPHPLPGTHWAEPPQQAEAGPELVPGQRDRMTPVFSTALPPKGISGALRRVAHMIPDHRVTHWVILLVADRIDVVEGLFQLPRPRT